MTWISDREREVTHDGWRVRQIRQSDGNWWNIAITRLTKDQPR